MKEKNLSLELVKFIAVIAVANHWMKPLFVKYDILATGGAIGDALFFFASGFTLFLGRFGRFDNWYKRRIRRIYPSIIAFTVLLSCLNITQLSACQVIMGGGLWFVVCIMIYYVILYFVRDYAEFKPMPPFIISILVLVLWYLVEDSSELFMYGETYFKWGHYFLFMLLGAYLGNNTIELESKPMKDGVMLIISLLLFYGIQILASRYIIISHLQIFTLIPLICIVLCIYKFSIAKSADKLLRTKIGLCIRFVAGLCLEIYIVNDVVIRFMTGKMTDLFPLNLLVTFITIVFLAYITRCMSRVFLQIFGTDDIDWKSIVKLV